MEKTPLGPLTSDLLGELAKEGSGTGAMTDALLIDLAKYPQRGSHRSDWRMENWQLGVLQQPLPSMGRIEPRKMGMEPTKMGSEPTKMGTQPTLATDTWKNDVKICLFTVLETGFGIFWGPPRWKEHFS